MAVDSRRAWVFQRRPAEEVSKAIPVPYAVAVGKRSVYSEAAGDMRFWVFKYDGKLDVVEYRLGDHVVLPNEVPNEVLDLAYFDVSWSYNCEKPYASYLTFSYELTTELRDNYGNLLRWPKFLDVATYRVVDERGDLLARPQRVEDYTLYLGDKVWEERGVMWGYGPRYDERAGYSKAILWAWYECGEPTVHPVYLHRERWMAELWKARARFDSVGGRYCNPYCRGGEFGPWDNYHSVIPSVLTPNNFYCGRVEGACGFSENRYSVVDGRGRTLELDTEILPPFVWPGDWGNWHLYPKDDDVIYMVSLLGLPRNPRWFDLVYPFVTVVEGMAVRQVVGGYMDEVLPDLLEFTNMWYDYLGNGIFVFGYYNKSREQVHVLVDAERNRWKKLKVLKVGVGSPYYVYVKYYDRVLELWDAAYQYLKEIGWGNDAHVWHTQPVIQKVQISNIERPW